MNVSLTQSCWFPILYILLQCKYTIAYIIVHSITFSCALEYKTMVNDIFLSHLFWNLNYILIEYSYVFLRCTQMHIIVLFQSFQCGEITVNWHDSQHQALSESGAYVFKSKSKAFSLYWPKILFWMFAISLSMNIEQYCIVSLLWFISL